MNECMSNMCGSKDNNPNYIAGAYKMVSMLETYKQQIQERDKHEEGSYWYREYNNRAKGFALACQQIFQKLELDYQDWDAWTVLDIDLRDICEAVVGLSRKEGILK